MNNFKSGSGDLDFGDNDEDEEENRETELEDDQSDPTPTEEQSPDTQPTKGSDAGTTGTTDVSASTEAHPSEPDFERNESSDRSGKNNFPYFVRRNNVGDERDKRLELHVREQVVEDEANFRNELADILDTSEISKTDAREFALLAAFQQPEKVAQLMQQEGFGAVD